MQVPPRLPLVIATILIALAAAAHTVAQSVQRSLYVSVIDKDGKPVPDLGPADFLVQEDRVTREVLTVGPANDPMQIALLVDNSQASDPFIRDYREALPVFINEMMDAAGPRNEMALIALADRPTILVDYTNDPKRLSDAVRRLFAMPASGATLLDAIFETARGLEKRETPRAVVLPVITDGTEFTNRYHTDVVAALERRFGRKLQANVVIDPELIGGIRVVVGDEVLDTSVKARLEQMKAALVA